MGFKSFFSSTFLTFSSDNQNQSKINTVHISFYIKTLNVKPFEFLAASSAVVLEKKLFTEMTTSLAARTTNGFNLSLIELNRSKNLS